MDITYVIVTANLWIIYEHIAMKLQIRRLVNDAESEKETRSRVSNRFDDRIRDLERIIIKRNEKQPHE